MVVFAQGIWGTDPNWISFMAGGELVPTMGQLLTGAHGNVISVISQQDSTYKAYKH